MTDTVAADQISLGSEIKRLRLALGMTLPELATRAGMREAYLAAIEGGREEPSARALRHLAQHLEPAGASFEQLSQLLTQPEFNWRSEYGERISEAFSFSGTGEEYFRIWIVNILLTIVTLGIYSPWAKVRQRQYFYRNTHVGGASFDYHGKPIAILKGRLIALALLAGYYGGGTLSPLIQLAAIALGAVVVPWLFARSFRFRFHNSSYRGIRFSFSGSTGSAYWVFLVLPLLAPFTLFALVPLCHHRIKRYQHGNASYGGTRFTFDAPARSFYRIYAMSALGLAAILVLAWFTFFGVTISVLLAFGTRPGQAAGRVVTLLVFVVLYWSMVFGLRSIVNAWVGNLVWRHTQLGAHRFQSHVKAVRLGWLTITNLVATIGTLGLFQPFAQVRLAKYLASTFSLIPAGSLDDFAASDEPEVSAIGDELVGLLDFDIAL
jgi:uncharacterized membrane protein YjgN (DUF898 family)